MSDFRFAFAGDRDISVWVLEYLLAEGFRPQALLLPDARRASHADALVRLCAHLPPERVLYGYAFREPRGMALLRELDLDVVVGIHFPYMVPEPVLRIPRLGVLNLHPAYLPWGRGWHTPSWALLQGTPIGATLHVMDTGVDSGDVLHQRALEVSPGDTANTLYARLKRLELEVFREAWPALVRGSCRRTPQPRQSPPAHRKQDLLVPGVQRIDLDERVPAGDLLRRLRALTTNRVDEAAYFDAGGTRYRVQVVIHEEPVPADAPPNDAAMASHPVLAGDDARSADEAPPGWAPQPR
jgi:methionyl-tRNA formyltransferase